MIDNPIKSVFDVGASVLTGVGMLTLHEWAGLLGICWWIYRFCDDFYGKWKRKKDK